LQLKNSFTAPEAVSLAPVPFQWQGRELIAAGGRHGLFLLDAVHLNKVAGYAEEMGDVAGSVATWQDPAGMRWIYSAGANKIVAFKVTDSVTSPKLERAWISHEMAAPGPPVVTNGVVFALASGPTHATLYALDAATGRELYSSGDTVTSITRSSGLAVANGHVCFGAADGTLYCFGIPFEQP
jgi:outer membrane protein assembly factor BamB